MRLADQLYADPEQAKRNYALINSLSRDAYLGDLDLSAGVSHPYFSLLDPHPVPGYVNSHAMSIVSWQDSFDRLEAALLTEDEERVDRALRDLVARARVLAPPSPSTRSISFTFPLLHMRTKILEIVMRNPEISPAQLETLASQVDDFPEIPEFAIFIDLAELEFRDIVEHHYSRSGRLVLSAIPGIGRRPYQYRSGDPDLYWSNIDALFRPRAEETLHIGQASFNLIRDRFEAHRHLADYQSDWDMDTFRFATEGDYWYLMRWLPNLYAQYEDWLKARAARVYLPVELRIIAYQRRHGEWPVTIGQIVQGSVPIDPATGHPLVILGNDNPQRPPPIGWADLVDRVDVSPSRHYGF